MLEYIIIWLVFTVFLAFFPLLCKWIAFCAISKDLILAEIIMELMFASVLLSADSIRTLQVSKKKNVIAKNIFWLNVPAILCSMVSYTCMIVAQNSGSSEGISSFYPFMISLVVAAFLFDVTAQLLYIYQGNLHETDFRDNQERIKEKQGTDESNKPGSSKTQKPQTDELFVHLSSENYDESFKQLREKLEKLEKNRKNSGNN